MTSCQSCQGYVNDNLVIVSVIHLQSCYCVQDPSTILSLCPGSIYNLVIVSRAHPQSCHCVQDPSTILSSCLGSIHNLVIVSRAHSQLSLVAIILTCSIYGKIIFRVVPQH